VQLEYEWWRTIAQDSFEQVGVQLANFDPFFQPMFAYFATAEPWFVYPEVPEVLARLKALGYQLAIISNFDSRLSAVLRALNLDPWFETVTISTQVGAAKPERAIFEAALAQQHCPPNRAWHVGDSWPEDYEGARAAGLWGVWLNRARAVVPSDHPNVNATLLEIETLTPLEAILSTQSQP
jgi:putative hydrolase of the HAD superfamily